MHVDSRGSCQISFISSIIAVIDAATKSHAVALAVSPLTSVALTLCDRVWRRIERLGLWIGIGNRSRHGLRFSSPAIAISIDPIAGWISLTLFLFSIYITGA